MLEKSPSKISINNIIFIVWEIINCILMSKQW